MTISRILLAGALAVAMAAIGSAQQSVTQEVRVIATGTGQVGGVALGGGPPPVPMAMGTGIIFGQAMEGDSDRPVPGALVTLMLRGAAPIRVLSDGQGRFAFRDLPAGQFNINTAKPGWVDGAYGRTRPGGMPQSLPLKDGERVSGMEVPMWRYSAIAGTVVDELGDPIVNAPVRILRRTVVGGQWRLVPGQMDMTDDRGAYRIGSLESGQYIVSVPMQQSDSVPMEPLASLPREAARDVMVRVEATATTAATAVASGEFMWSSGPGGDIGAGMSEDGHPLAYPTVFYPASASASRATVVSLGAGEERTGIDFELKPVRTVRVSGVVTGPEGPVGNLGLTLIPTESDELVSQVEIISAFTSASGQFTFDAVPPGQYTLRAVQMPRAPMPAASEMTTIQQGNTVMVMRLATASGAQPPLPTAPTLWAEMPLSIAAKDITDLAVGMRTGLKVSGSVQFDGGAERPTAEQLASSISISLEPADSRPGTMAARGRMESSGQFSTMGVPPGRYLLRVRAGLQGWNFRAALANGRDISDTPVELEAADVAGVILSFSDRTSELDGQVSIESGSTDATTVLAFPADASAWVGYGSASKRLIATRVDQTGNFSIKGLPGGEYFVIALPDKAMGDWPAPDFLEKLSAQATRVRVRDGEKVTQTLKVVK